MKKVVVVLMVAVLAFAVFACAASPAENETASSSAAGGQAEPAGNGEGIVVGLDILQDDSMGKQMIEAAEGFCAERGWELMTSVNDMDEVRTVSNIETFITKGVDYIMVHLVDLGVQETVQQKCDEAGIPVVFVGVIDDGFVLINSNDFVAGEVMGEKVALGAKEKWGDEPVDLVITYGISSLGKLNSDRLEGMISGVRKHYDVPDDKYIVLDGERDSMQVTQLVSGVLTANPDAERIIYVGIHSMWDMGAFNAFESAGRLDQLVMGTWHCYLDTLPDLMKEYPQTIIGSMDLPGGEYVTTAFELFDKMNAGETVEKDVYLTGYQWLDASNIDEFYQFG